MKLKPSPLLRFRSRSTQPSASFFTMALGMAAAGLALFSSPSAEADTLFWDGGTVNIGTDGDGASTGTAGTWNTTLTNWDAGAAPHVAWTNSLTTNDASFGGTAGLVTLGSAITTTGITFTNTAAGGYNIATNATGSLTLGIGASGITSNNTTTTNTLSGTGGITLGADQSWNQASGGILAVSSAVAKAGFLLTVNGAGTTNLSGVVSGSGGLTQSGTGILELRGANTYTGGTTLSSGTIEIFVGNVGSVGAITSSALGTDTLTINGGAISARLSGRTLLNAVTVGGDFSLNGATGGGNKLTLAGPVDLGSATRIISVLAAGGAEISGAVSGSGAGLTKAGANTLTLSGANTYNGATTINQGTLLFTKSASLYNSDTASWTAANINVASGATLSLRVGGTDEFTTSNLNTLLGNISVANSATEGLQAGARIAFDTVNAAGGTFTQGNLISDSTGASGGAIGVTKLGANILVLDKANTYSGGTTIGAGTVTLGNASALGASTGALTLNGGTLNLNGNNISQSGITFNGGVLTATGGGVLSLNSTDTAIRFTGTPAAASSGAAINLTGATGGDIIKSATAGTPILSGALDLGGVSRTIALADTAADVAELTLSGQVSNGGIVLNNGLGGTSTQDFGTLVLSGTNTYDGATLITKGRIVINNASSLGSSVGGTTIESRGTLALGGAGITIAAAGITVAENLTLNRNNTTGEYASSAIQNNSGNNILSGTISLSSNASIDVAGGSLAISNSISETAASSLTKTGGSLLTLSGSNSYSGGTTINGGGIVINADAALGAVPVSAATNVTFSGSGSLQQASATSALTLNANRSIVINTGATATFNAGGAANVLTINGEVSNQTSTGNFRLATAASGSATTGTVVLTGSNNFAAGSIISLGAIGTNIGGGILRLANSNALGSNAVTIAGNGSGQNVLGEAAVELTGGITIGSNVTFNLSGHGNAGLTTGDHLRNVSGNNTFNGTINITNTGGSYQIDSADADSLLTIGGNITNTLTSASARALNVIGAGDTLISGIVGENNPATAKLGLAKSGAGTLTLSASNTYSGATTVSSGTLLVNGSLGNTTVTVNGGTFGGTGTIAGSVNVGAATYAPGASPGSLEIAGNLTLDSASTTAIEIGGTAFTLNGVEQYDRTKLTGSTPTLTVAGALAVSLFGGFTLADNQAFGIFQLDSGANRLGTFAGLDEDGFVGSVGGQDVYITYQGDFGDSGVVSTFGGNDIVLYTIPEPRAAALGALGLLMLLRRRQR
jgi:autotransporter-associated beta strand protein